MREDVKDKVVDLLSHTKFKEKSPTPTHTTNITQKITGNNNTQVIGNVYNTTKPPAINVLPSPESIAGDPLLKLRIEELFKNIGQAREKRYGKGAYPVMYRYFKKDFKIPKETPWTIIWKWPKSCAYPIIDYLEGKYSRTIQGKIEKAASKEGYFHTRKHLYRIEKELLEQIGLDMKSPELRELLESYFGVLSHTKLTHLQHWQLVIYLENYVKEVIGE